MKSGRPFSTNEDTTSGWTKPNLRAFSSLRELSIDSQTAPHRSSIVFPLTHEGICG
jgi:hypothetical protein